MMQVLLQLGDTKLKRTASLMCPDLFQFEQHFEFLGIIGRSQHSEVSWSWLFGRLLIQRQDAFCGILPAPAPHLT